MLYKPKVFISHGAKEAEAKHLCQSIASRLTDAGFELLWDANLQTSQAWRAVIDEWIWRCDAAVLVLSEAATESRYVAYEAALLRQRWRYQFTLVPVWCPGVDEQLLVARMGALQIAEIQTNVKIQHWPVSFDAVAKTLEDALRPALTNLSPRHDIEKVLMIELNSGTGSEAALTAIADEYKLPQFPVGAKDSIARALARRMLDSSEALGQDRFGVLAKALPTMKAAIADEARVSRIVKYVAPFCWVLPEAALRIALLATQPAGQPRVVAWARTWSLAERMYIYRGYCARSRDRLRIANASDVAGGSKEEILRHIGSILSSQVLYRSGGEPKRVAEEIRKLGEKGIPVFLLLPAHSIDGEVLEATLALWPDLCVFLFGDDEAELRENFPGVAILDPPLTPQEEDAALMGWGDCIKETDPRADPEKEESFL